MTPSSPCFPPLPPAQCEMSEWSLWGPCSKKKKLCGFRRGLEERTRRVLHAPGGDHAVCSDTKETRKCTVRRTPCPEGELRLGVRGQHGCGRSDHLFPTCDPEEGSGQGQLGHPQLRTPCCANPCQVDSDPRNCVGWREASVVLSLPIASDSGDAGTGQAIGRGAWKRGAKAQRGAVIWPRSHSPQVAMMWQWCGMEEWGAVLPVPRAAVPCWEMPSGHWDPRSEET